jgi:hypothetical protein
MRRVVLAAALLALAAPATAAADTDWDNAQPVTDARLDVAARAAQAYWGGGLPYACAHGGIRWRAMQSIEAPDGSRTVAVADLKTCRPWVAVDWLATASAADVCKYVVHEVGHMYGLDHDQPAASLPDPVAVMNDGALRPMGMPAQCLNPSSLPPVATLRADGRTRSRRRAADRRWCRRHPAKCAAKYPNLTQAAVRYQKEARRGR